MLIDQRFLSPHPRTLLWWQQREQCRQCAHYVRVPTSAKSNGGDAEHCLLGHNHGGSTAWTPSSACIDMRDAGSACGPDGRLFMPLEARETYLDARGTSGCRAG